MKKILSLTLAFVLCLSICACSQAADTDDTKPTEQIETDPTKPIEKSEKTYKSAIQKWEAVMNGDSDTYKDMAPDAYWAYMAEQAGMTKSEYISARTDEFKSDYSDISASWAELIGSDPTVTVTITDTYPIETYQLTTDAILTALEDSYNIKPSAVADAIAVKVDMTLQGTNGSQPSMAGFIAVEIDSDWYLLDSNYDDEAIDVWFHFFLFETVSAPDSSQPTEPSTEPIEPASSYLSAVEAFVAVYNGNAEKIENLAPKEYWDYMADQSGITTSEYLNRSKANLENTFPNQVASWIEMVGENPTVTFKILDSKKATDAVFNGVAITLNKQYSVNIIDIKEIYDLNLKLTLTGSSSSFDSWVERSAVKIGSEWYLFYYYELDGGEYYVGFNAP